MRCLIGFDDTDSHLGHCTTHLGFQMISALMREGCEFRTYPRLVRLNPNVPFKTRGNAAVCLEIHCSDPGSVFEVARSLVQENADVGNGANPGLVFFEGPAEEMFSRIYCAAISGMVSHRGVLKALEDLSVRYWTLGNGMGVVGAAASLGFDPVSDHTYEVIAYRRPEMCGRPREMDVESVKQMERATFPHTFNNYDHRSGRVLIAPHGPDPVFLGIRADSPEASMRALGMVKYEEVLAGHVIYLSNQCTDAHLRSELPRPLKAFSSGWVEGEVRRIVRGEGGHVYFHLRAREGSELVCAVYEPAGDLKRVASALCPGDELRVFGGVRRPSKRHEMVVNTEKIEVRSVASVFKQEAPVCSACGRRTKSEGRGKGFRCKNCGKTALSRKISVRLGRSLVPGTYLPSAGAQRHLTKQLIRYGRENQTARPLVEGWFVGGNLTHTTMLGRAP